MAGYRQFHTKFWKDGWVIELDPLERYLYSYLFTNEQSSISGIFELPLRVIVFETGLDKDFIESTLSKFQDAKKIFYQDNIMWVVKMREHHKNASPLTMKKVNADVDTIPDCQTKRMYQYYIQNGKYSIDTVSIPTSLSVSVSEKESRSETDPLPVNIFKLYENEIGVLTKVVSDKMSIIEQDYPQDWISDAITEAATHNARNLAYIEAILKRRKIGGGKNKKSSVLEGADFFSNGEG